MPVSVEDAPSSGNAASATMTEHSHRAHRALQRSGQVFLHFLLALTNKSRAGYVVPITVAPRLHRPIRQNPPSRVGPDPRPRKCVVKYSTRSRFGTVRLCRCFRLTLRDDE